jgi:hypothetical protein
MILVTNPSYQMGVSHLDVWQPAHEGDAAVAEKLVSNNF